MQSQLHKLSVNFSIDERMMLSTTRQIDTTHISVVINNAVRFQNMFLDTTYDNNFMNK